ncbi:DUF4962 domain-containing protein [Candidatus Poribacteria bacterium]|nr:DUF4962 domain-containing protein [Candidatus Poribacteria bacterium]
MAPVTLLVMAVVCGGLFARTALAATTIDESPAEPGEWGFRPEEGRATRVNPPGFVWRPQRDAASYRFQLSRTVDFVDVAYEATDLALFAHCPPQSFEEGDWHWRFGYSTVEGDASDWSRARPFRIAPDATEFPMPVKDELLSRIPTAHPRLFLRPEDLPGLQELSQADLRATYDRLVRTCEKLLVEPPPTEEPAKYPDGMERGSDPWREIWWGNRRYTTALLNAAATLAFTRLLNGNDAYGDLAKRLLMAAAEWDPTGATGYRYNDEAGMPYNYYFSRTYTFLHDALTEAERAKCREVMKIRGDEMYAHLHPRHLWKPYGSHANRAWHFLGEIAVAFHGEVEGADDWLWFAMNVFYNAYPVWSDDDGGWHEGLGYWRSYVGRFLWWADIMRSAMDVDAYKKPFFSQAGFYPMYLQAPGATRGGFGDLTAHLKSDGNVDLMRIFAAQAQNPYWQWYVDAHGKEFVGDDYTDFIRGALPAVAAKPPDDLPDSRVFWGTGLAMLHSDVTNAKNDVFIEFKSSPFGSHSHGYDAQNSFVLSAYGEPVFIRTGRRDSYGSDHHKNWQWQTKSVNSVLVNNEGQGPRSQSAQGRILGFYTSKEFDYVAGEAGDAYGGKLDRFTRRILFLKPDVVIILDDLEAPEPSTFQWLLHSPNEMQLGRSAVHAVSGPVMASATIMPSGFWEAMGGAGESLRITQTDQFDPPPRPRIKLTQWHATASTVKRRRREEFVTLIKLEHFVADPDADHGHMVDTSMMFGSLDAGAGVASPVDLSDGRAIVLRRTGEGALEAEGVGTDADLAVVRLDANGDVVRAFRVGGSRLTYCGEDLDAGTPETQP